MALFVGYRGHSKRHSSGFTLLELMLAVGIVSVLASIAIPLFNRFIFEAKVSDATRALYQTGRDIEAARIRNPEFEYVNAIQSSVGPSLDLAYEGSKTSFNIVTGNPPAVSTQDSLTSNDFVFALSQLEGMAYLKPSPSRYSLNAFGFRTSGTAVDRTRIMIGAELDVDQDGFFHVIALNERGQFFELCNDRTNQVDSQAHSEYSGHTGFSANCRSDSSDFGNGGEGESD